MGKTWFSAVKKAFSPEPKEKKEQKPHKSKKKWFGKHKKLLDPVTSPEEAALKSTAPCGVDAPPAAPILSAQLPLPSSVPVVDNVKLADTEDEQSRHAYSVALATAVAAEAAVAAAQAAAEVVRLTAASHFAGKSREEIAAVKIQTAFRGYMARRALRALRGLVRLKTLIQGQSVKRQATATLQCMQTLARVQYQIRERRLRMSEENQDRIKQLQQKHEKETEKVGEGWDYSTLSKEQIEASLLSKHEAAMRRERALAYAYTHQGKNSSKFGHQTFMDPNNPHWGWSWLERWMAARPWENRSTIDNSDKNSARSTASRTMSEIIPYNKGSSPRPRKPSPRGKIKNLQSPKVSHANGDDDSRSNLSIQSEQIGRHRHSICGSSSSFRDDESLTSSPSVPNYMAPTQAAKARSRFSSPSPLGLEKVNGSIQEKGSVGSAKKRLSFSGSPRVMRRHSGPPMVESSAIKRDQHGLSRLIEG